MNFYYFFIFLELVGFIFLKVSRSLRIVIILLFFKVFFLDYIDYNVVVLIKILVNDFS